MKNIKKPQIYINFGYVDDMGTNFVVAFKKNHTFEDFKIEILKICQNFSIEEKKKMIGTSETIEAITEKLKEKKWNIIVPGDALVEAQKIYTKDMENDAYFKYCYEEHVELFGKEFMDSLLSNIK